ncbi:hypothetical protein J2T56_002320 [Natronobacillus azotifigens]|uniref:Uncharacterized protein n=1 Tax=Natronobacillus azotifigens TaxID=472978 RepID=A0A9J6RF96_9BACI|nr:SA1362 family protein [Natronobacillus azotifigens]MCZ0704078.1 hypothetical protein [Natronobacillus azotifigens]
MSRTHRFPLFIYLLIGLALFGLTHQLFTNTNRFIANTLVIIGFGALVYTVIYFLFIRKRMTDDLKKYRRAAKLSKKRYGTNSKLKSNYSQTKKKKTVTNYKRRREQSVPHLRVIEGKKNKKNDRASL